MVGSRTKTPTEDTNNSNMNREISQLIFYHHTSLESGL
jgi:hypothetical protein